MYPEVKPVVPVPPEAIASVLERPAAVPVVFWFSVGNVQFARLPDWGVPKIGVVNDGLVNDGLVDNTLLPEPVEDVTPVPPLATGKVPVTLVVRLTNVVEVVPVPPLAMGSVPVISPVLILI